MYKTHQNDENDLQMRCLRLLGRRIKFHDVHDGCFRSKVQSEKSKGTDDDVLPDDPVVLSEALVPVGDHLNEDRNQQAEDRETEGAEKTDERTDGGDGDRQQNGGGDQNSSHHVVDERGAFGELLLDGVPSDLQADVELKSECAEHGQGDQNFHNLSGYLLDWQVQRYGSERIVAVLDEAQKAEQNVNERDARHSLVQHTAESDKVLRRLHRVLQWHHNADRFHGEDDDAEERRNLEQRCVQRAVGDWRHVLRQVVESDQQSDSHEDIRDGRERRKVFEIWHPREQNQGNQKHGDENANVDASMEIVLDDLHEVLRDDDGIDRAGAEVCDEQAVVDEMLHELSPGTSP